MLLDEWHTANVKAIFKKGNVELCANYRPISLICVAYKLFATLILTRLKDGGAEKRLTETQFGFSKRLRDNRCSFCSPTAY